MADSDEKLTLTLTDSGAVAVIGRGESVPGPGQRVIAVDDGHYAAYIAVAAKLADGQEIAYDEQAGTFSARTRTLTPAQQAEATTRALVIGVAQSSAGQNIAALSAIQVRALLAILLWKQGALDATGVVRPLSDWIK